MDSDFPQSFLTLPSVLLQCVYSYDSTYKRLFDRVVRDLNKLPTLNGYYDVLPDSRSQQVEFLFVKYRGRRHHIFCAFQCYLNVLFFTNAVKYQEEREEYSKDLSLYSTPHSYVCNYESYGSSSITGISFPSSYFFGFSSNVIVTNNYSCPNKI